MDAEPATVAGPRGRPPDGPERSRWRRPAVVVPIAAVLAAATGAAGVAVQQARADRYVPHPASVRSLTLPGVRAAPAGVASPAAPAAPVAAGRSPAAVVRAYLAARSHTDDQLSFALLAPAARRSFGTVAGWRSTEANRPRPVGFTVTAARGPNVRVVIRQQPSLDPLNGFVPGRLRATYSTVRTAAGWRVSPDPVAVTAVLPAEGMAASAAARWLALESNCDSVGAGRLQVSSGLLGDVGYATAPCSAGGSWRSGAATTLVEGPRAQPFLAAYGSGVGSWARVVPVSSPHGARFLVALAPLGAQWRVFGLIRDGTGGSGVAVG